MYSARAVPGRGFRNSRPSDTSRTGARGRSGIGRGIFRIRERRDRRVSGCTIRQRWRVDFLPDRWPGLPVPDLEPVLSHRPWPDPSSWNRVRRRFQSMFLRLDYSQDFCVAPEPGMPGYSRSGSIANLALDRDEQEALLERVPVWE